MQYYPDRPSAIRAAQDMGWETFDTQHTPGQGHYPVRADGPIAEWARVWAEDYMVERYRSRPGTFVAHVGHRDKKPLIRITCPVSELLPGQIPPDAFIVEPFAESMLSDDVHTGPKRAAASSGGSRERTSAPGAVSLVHDICDALNAKGAFDRKAAVAEAVAQGVHPSTAATQVYRWRKNNEK